MVTEQVRSDSDDAHDMQDLVVHRVPGSLRESVFDAGRGRGFSFAAVRIHNNHISAWRSWGRPAPGQKGTQPVDEDGVLVETQYEPLRWSARCPVCSKGLEGTLAALVKRPPTAAVVARRRADREEATAHARDSRPDRGENPVLW